MTFTADLSNQIRAHIVPGSNAAVLGVAAEIVRSYAGRNRSEALAEMAAQGHVNETSRHACEYLASL